MNERIRQSVDYVRRTRRYAIDESTVTVLNEERACWVANATTTHLKAYGEEEVTLVVLVQDDVNLGRYNVTIVSHDVVPGLAQWFSQHWTEEEHHA
jgi:hypothetical protein